jgi:hypothetical protein
MISSMPGTAPAADSAAAEVAPVAESVAAVVNCSPSAAAVSATPWRIP